MSGGGLLVVRADSTPEIGVGHVMRCLALGEAWRAGGSAVTFAGTWSSPALIERLRAAGFRTVPLPGRFPDDRDLTELLRLLEQTPGGFERSWVAVDGYGFTAEYHRALGRAGVRVLLLDDTAALESYDAAVVLNQNLDAEELTYRHGPATRLLLGPRYVLLREEFRSGQRARRTPAAARRILVTMGGADPEDLTSRVVHGLAQAGIPGLEARIVIGPENRRREQVRELAQRHGYEEVAGAPDMPALMSWAELAVSAAGSTCWELAYLGLPAAVVVAAENQRRVAEGLERRGVAWNLGWHAGAGASDFSRAVRELAQDPGRRAEMSRRGRALIDGKGVHRVLRALRSAGPAGRS